MDRLDEMFPNRQDCYFALFQDAVYEHDDRINYVFQANQFKRRDRVTIINKVKAMAELVYSGFVDADNTFAGCQPSIDYPSRKQRAFQRIFESITFQELVQIFAGIFPAKQ